MNKEDNGNKKFKDVLLYEDGFLLDPSFDFDDLEKYEFEVDEVGAKIEDVRNKIGDQIYIYRDTRRPLWFDTPKISKKLQLITRHMFEDGIITPMSWDDYVEWRRKNCEKNGFLKDGKKANG
jgi:hypothetical protein